MVTTPALRDRYAAEARGDDPNRSEVARRQLARLGAGATPPAGERAPSRWAHIPLSELFAQAGNTVRVRPDGSAECGHEPFHASRSGRCVCLDEVAGRWYCRSCRRGGDAATLVMDLHGWPYPRAAAWLDERYGAPNGRTSRPRRRARWVEA